MSRPSTDKGRRSFVVSRSASGLAIGAFLEMQIIGQVQSVHAYINPVAESERTGEVSGWTRRRTQAYQKVRSDLQRSGQRLGANAVIDVCFVHQLRDWVDDCVELTALGTAVRVKTADAREELPFVTTLTSQEIHALHEAGYAPAGYVIGVCAYRQKAHLRVQRKLQMGSRSTLNGEHTDFSAAFTKARTVALSRMMKDAMPAETKGVIGVTLERTFHYRQETAKTIDDMLFLMTATGTPVVSIREHLPTVSYHVPLSF